MSIGTHYITVGLDVSRQIKEAQRLADRRSNAIDVLEEAAAEMAREWQTNARFEYGYLLCLQDDNDPEPMVIRQQEFAAGYYRLARRYLLALVGDGRGEE